MERLKHTSISRFIYCHLLSLIWNPPHVGRLSCSQITGLERRLCLARSSPPQGCPDRTCCWSTVNVPGYSQRGGFRFLCSSPSSPSTRAASYAQTSWRQKMNQKRNIYQTYIHISLEAFSPRPPELKYGEHRTVPDLRTVSQLHKCWAPNSDNWLQMTLIFGRVIWRPTCMPGSHAYGYFFWSVGSRCMKAVCFC